MTHSEVPKAPTFVHIGGQRCGTTWVHAALEEHPAVFLPPEKEIHYLDRQLERGDDWYLSLFRPNPAHTAWGELTPSYLDTNGAPERLARIAPDARLIVCVRDPVERAFSAYRLRRHADMAGLSFREAVDRQVDNIVERGFYLKYIEQWLQHFPREQLLIQTYDDLARDNASFIREIYAFLGIDPDFRPSSIGRVKNAVIFPRVQDTLRRTGLGWAIAAVRSTPIGNMIRRAGAKRIAAGAGRGYAGPDDDTALYLADIYRDANAQLAEFIQRDLSSWTGMGPHQQRSACQNTSEKRTATA